MIAALGIGGTHFHSAIGTASGTLRTEVATEPTRTNALVAQVVDAVEALQEQASEPLEAVGVASRGLVAPGRGVIRKIDVKNGATVHDVDLGAAIEREFGVPLYLENDCTAAALAEYYFGAGRAHDSVVHVTIGTGIGAGVIDNGAVVRGERNFAGEVGGIPVGPTDGLEAFGIPGAWEAYCSGPGILEYVESRLAAEDRSTALLDRDGLEPQHVFEVAADGDGVAQEYLDVVIRYDAAGFGTIANMYDPGVVTVGGGVARNNQRWLLDGLDEHLEEFLVVERPDVLVTDFEDEIGIFGAIAACVHERAGGPSGASEQRSRA